MVLRLLDLAAAHYKDYLLTYVLQLSRRETVTILLSLLHLSHQAYTIPIREVDLSLLCNIWPMIRVMLHMEDYSRQTLDLKAVLPSLGIIYLLMYLNMLLLISTKSGEIRVEQAYIQFMKKMLNKLFLLFPLQRSLLSSQFSMEPLGRDSSTSLKQSEMHFYQVFRTPPIALLLIET